ncbi:CaiB/BaiF CoA transferase family protein [Trinickia mobilis]|uniref:CaiB/BaiF CoA transferase family protein n=1 Tax=Trinickia mobilis TaxID=2816356 RepID=UPI001A8EEE7A|nr:CoA transferase [Trinickia mobilis]
MQKILDGVVVLDLTRFFSGPQCTLLLAGLGAEVIKIDDPKTADPTASAPPFVGPLGVSLHRQTDDDFGIAYLKRARNKKSMALDLKSDAGRQLFFDLVEKADVVVENFSVGVTDRLGIGYRALQERRPDLIYCSLTGYGSSGPASGLKAYDLMVQAATGLMSITGQPGGSPVKTGSPLSDAVAGVFAANGVIAALLHRFRTGEGQAIDVSMADCLFSLILDEPLDCYSDLGLGYQQGNRIMRFSPFNAYPALDGWVALGAATNADWLKLLEIMGRADLKADPNMMELSWRIENNAYVDQIVSDWTQVRARDEIIRVLEAAALPCSPVRTVDDVMRWDHLRERKMITRLRHPVSGEELCAHAPGFPIKFSRTPGGYEKPAPIPKAHSDELLHRFLGLDQEYLDAMRNQGVI